MDPVQSKLNLTLGIDGGRLYYGSFRQWQNFISALSEGRAMDYSHSVRFGEESLTAMVSYLRRSFPPCTAIPEPEQYGLRLNPPTPPDGELAKQLFSV